jgi:hypothetical protein
MLTFRLRFYPSPCLTLELYIATIATLVNNKKHLFLFFFWNEYGDPGNFESDEQLFG